ncbi:hypothetical protein IWZ03DRAFT_222694 [Phyllosticta citriasiana]|uniref:DNA-directed DNA polymerase n=1 Tax=Phyllosticta citriasiana TaxID=595635 RepID=A0ABR1KM54_9PEZI
MASSPLSSSPTLASSSQRPQSQLDLSSLPPVFVLPTHLTVDDLHELEDKLAEHGARMTYDIREAKIVIGKVGTKRRAQLELRSRKLFTREATPANTESSILDPEPRGPPQKRRKIEDHSSRGDSSTEDKAEAPPTRPSRSAGSGRSSPSAVVPSSAGNGASAELFDSNQIRVIKMDWIDNSSRTGKLLPMKDYLVYEGKPTEPPSATPPFQAPYASKAPIVIPASPSSRGSNQTAKTGQSILDRAKADASSETSPKQRRAGFKGSSSTRFSNRRFASSSQPATWKSRLLHKTTSEHEGSSSNDGKDLPPLPAWVKQRKKYACERATPADPPNATFINQLKQIRLARALTGDEIGVRAYSTSIAALAAYPYKLRSANEVARLPGCDGKIVGLWQEWRDSHEEEGKRALAAVRAAESDPEMKVLRLFHGIWGVGATTARNFLLDLGWCEIDDVVEHGWSTLSRVQQIGVKYYNEFQEPVPHSEVESIAATIRTHAMRLRGEGVEIALVGGYRRGKTDPGDVDIIVSHRQLECTQDLVTDLIEGLEEEGWITHTLLLSTANSTRGQATLPFINTGSAAGGFDSLDKALVVWQDPQWDTREADLARNPKAKNPNPHRRVDIIVSPWRTMGCAVLGWTGDTTFERDLRRYVKNEKNWKFDSSGLRDRLTGQVLLLEGPDGIEGSWVDAEKKVFDALGLEWREPWERCTG